LATRPTLSRSVRVSVFAGLLALALARTASAQITPAKAVTPPDDTQSIKIGAVVFYDYTFQESPKVTDSVGNVVSSNSFNVSRAYLNVTGNISHRLSFRITTDVARETSATPSLSGSLIARLKYGFAQYNFDDWTGNWKQTWVRLGIQVTPLIDYTEGIYRYRFQGTTFYERVGALTSSDAGVSFHSNLPSNYGDFQVGLYNGEGYSKPEANNEKAFQVRGSLRPLATSTNMAMRGLRVTGFYDADNSVMAGQRRRAAFQATFEHKHANAAFDFLRSHDLALPAASPSCQVAVPPAACGVLVNGQGWSFWATPAFKEKGNGPELLLRFDDWQPNTAVTPKVTMKTAIIGFAYWFPHPGGGATSALMVDFEQVKKQGTLTQQKYFVHGLINF